MDYIIFALGIFIGVLFGGAFGIICGGRFAAEYTLRRLEDVLAMIDEANLESINPNKQEDK